MHHTTQHNTQIFLGLCFLCFPSLISVFPMEIKTVCNALHGLKPVLLMILVQILFAAVNLLYKLSLNDGMSVKVATAYRHAFATAATVPIALISERKKRVKITWRVLFMAFLCGLFGGVLYQNFFFEGMALTSSTFMSAIYNLIPGITFILAISCGFERLNWTAASGKAKVLGTIVGIGGAMTLTFYKGTEFNIWPFHVNILHPHHNQNSNNGDIKLLGVFFAVVSCFSFASWLIIQAKMSKEYPSPYSSAALMSAMGTIQATVYALCAEKDWSQWKLGLDIKLLTVAYSGIVASGLVVIIITWCVKMRGPVFTSAFNPVVVVIVAVVASLVLDEKLNVGSVLGAALIVCGLYMVLWGKNKELKKNSKLVPSEIIQSTKAVEVVVMSMPENDDKRDNNNNYCQACTMKNVNKDHEIILSQNGEDR